MGTIRTEKGGEGEDNKEICRMFQKVTWKRDQIEKVVFQSIFHNLINVFKISTGKRGPIFHIDYGLHLGEKKKT